MDVFQYFSEHHDQLLYLIAGLSFILELTVLGIGGPLLFFAIASALSGILVSFGLISGWEAEVLVVGVLTGIIALVLWKPLKRFQNSGGGSDTSSDMIGRQVRTSSEVTINGGSIRFSGVDWSSRLSQDCGVKSIASDTLCVISSVDGNVMVVKPL